MNRFTQKVLSGGIAAGLSCRARPSASPGGAFGGLDPERPEGEWT